MIKSSLSNSFLKLPILTFNELMKIYAKCNNVGHRRLFQNIIIKCVSCFLSLFSFNLGTYSTTHCGKKWKKCFDHLQLTCILASATVCWSRCWRSVLTWLNSHFSWLSCSLLPFMLSSSRLMLASWFWISNFSCVTLWRSWLKHKYLLINESKIKKKLLRYLFMYM